VAWCPKLGINVSKPTWSGRGLVQTHLGVGRGTFTPTLGLGVDASTSNLGLDEHASSPNLGLGVDASSPTWVWAWLGAPTWAWALPRPPWGCAWMHLGPNSGWMWTRPAQLGCGRGWVPQLGRGRFHAHLGVARGCIQTQIRVGCRRV
jgi:hypothetical protein